MKMFKLTFALALSIFFVSNAFGQERKFTVSYEYLAHVSALSGHHEKTGEQLSEHVKFSHHGLFRIERSGNSKFKSTIGLGFLNTGESISISPDRGAAGLGISHTKYRDNYNYLFIPVGIKYTLGKFHILPEIGVGHNMVSNRRITTSFADGEVLNELITLSVPQSFRKITLPIMLSVGGEFKLNQFVISSGVKAYYGLNSLTSNELDKSHYSGIGVFLGVGF